MCIRDRRFSHGTAVRRALDAGVGRVVQIGTRALSREEAAFAEADKRVETWFACDFMGVCDGQAGWAKLIERVNRLEGAVWLTFDVDGLDASEVPSTGTPVPGGIYHWAAVDLIERLFAAPGATVIGADVNEIVPGQGDSVTQFNAALIAAKIVACHAASRLSQKD